MAIGDPAMTAKSRLKQYFETGKIPTQAQFHELIDSMFSIIGSSDGSLNVNNDENKIRLSIKNYRSLQDVYQSKSVSLHLFFNNDINHGTKAVPVLIIISTIGSLTVIPNANIKYAVPDLSQLKSMASDTLDYLTARLDTIIERLNDLKIKTYDLIPKPGVAAINEVAVINEPSLVTIMFNTINGSQYIYNCIMGMGEARSSVPIIIHGLVKIKGFTSYAGTMSFLQDTIYNSTKIESEWEKITKLPGYTSGLITDSSGVAERFLVNICPHYYK